MLIDEHFSRGNDVTLALRQTHLGSAVALRDHRVVDISNRFGIAGITGTEGRLNAGIGCPDDDKPAHDLASATSSRASSFAAS